MGCGAGYNEVWKMIDNIIVYLLALSSKISVNHAVHRVLDYSLIAGVDGPVDSESSIASVLFSPIAANIC